MLFGRGAAWKGYNVLRPLLVNSPIFSLRLVYMTVGASAHFASFVLEQVLDALPFAGQLHFKVIVHFSHHGLGCQTHPLRPFYYLKLRLGRQLSYSSELALVIRLVAFPRRGPFFLQPSFHIRLFRRSFSAPSGMRKAPGEFGGETSPEYCPFSCCCVSLSRYLLQRDALHSR